MHGVHYTLASAIFRKPVSSAHKAAVLPAGRTWCLKMLDLHRVSGLHRRAEVICWAGRNNTKTSMANIIMSLHEPEPLQRKSKK
jgi:hypothetical protein